jgi:ferric-dicitrate binding protein FerR (iron transport regulator)
MLIHDISTSFDVYKKRNSTLVTVIEGRVRVVAPLNPDLRVKFDRGEADNAWRAAPEFRQLQQFEFNEATRTLHVRPELSESKLSQRLAWQGGRIHLTGLTLGEALEEFSRYQPIQKFNFQDEALGKIPVGGELESTDLQDFLKSLEDVAHIHYTITGSGGDTVVTLSRQQKHSRTERPF